MSYIPIPDGSILDNFEFYRVINKRKVYTNTKKSRFYSWDELHGEVEVFDANGFHLGALDPMTGKLIKDAVKGRTLNVR